MEEEEEGGNVRTQKFSLVCNNFVAKCQANEFVGKRNCAN